MKRICTIFILALTAASCIQDPECPTNPPDAPKLSVDETSVTRVSMVVDGRWEALRFNDDPTSTAFVALFEGSNLDLYIIAWGQHYVGTYQYADGAIVYTISEAYQAYTDVTATSHSWEAGNLDASTLTLSDGYDWYQMDPDTLANYKEDLQEFSFLLQDGNNSATSALFGLDIVFTKVN